MSKSKKKGFNGKAPITIIGVIIIGLIVSAMYDLLVKPGLSNVGRLALDFFTFGSQTIKDSAYSSASLDPRPVSVLLLVIPLLAFVYLPILLPLFDKILDYYHNKKKCEEERKDSYYISKIALFVLKLVYVVGVTIAFSIHNQSIIIWRTFHSNLNIVTPYIDTNERNKLRSKFALMEHQSDYKVIADIFNKVSEKEKIKLKDINLW